MWQFLQRCSHVSAAYDQRQRNWERMYDNEPVVPNNIVNPLLPQLNRDMMHIEQDLLLNNVLDNQPDPPNVPHTQDGIENRNTCMVCMVISLQQSIEHYIIIPCGHAWVCNTCVGQLNHLNAACPMCRARNISFQRIFFT